MKWTPDKRKASFRRSSLFKKMLASYVSLTLLVVALTSLASFLLLHYSAIRSNREELRQKADRLAVLLAEPDGIARALSGNLFEDWQLFSDAQFAYINKDRRVQSIAPGLWTENTADLEDLQQVDPLDELDSQSLSALLDEGRPINAMHRLDFLDDDVIFAGSPVIDAQGRQMGAVLLYRPVRQMERLLSRIVAMTGIPGLVALLAAISLAFLMSRRLSRPLALMNDVAQQIAEGHYGRVVDARRNDEIGQLGGTLNLLSCRLVSVIKNLGEEKNKLEQVLSSIAEGVFSVDQNGNMVHCNLAALELLGLRKWSDSGDEEAKNRRNQILSMVMESIQEGRRLQLTLSAAANRTAKVVISPIFDEDGSHVGAVCMIRDVSETQRLEQMQRDYIANVSHELRTPLTGIRGMVEPLMDGVVESKEEQMQFYRVIYQETLRLERLIGEMLDLSRLQEGRTTIPLEAMQPYTLLGVTASRLKDPAEKNGIALQVMRGGEDILVMGNEDRILQVLTILTDNALKFTAPGGWVRLGMRRPEPGKVEFSVSDNGAGIAAEDIPHIFERFYKADKSRMNTPGMGLGLPIAKLIVERMGGKMQTRTELGKGSTFSFLLEEAP